MSFTFINDATETPSCIFTRLSDTQALSLTTTLTFLQELVPDFQSAPFTGLSLPASVVAASFISPNRPSAANCSSDAGPCGPTRRREAPPGTSTVAYRAVSAKGAWQPELRVHSLGIVGLANFFLHQGAPAARPTMTVSRHTFQHVLLVEDECIRCGCHFHPCLPLTLPTDEIPCLLLL